MGVKFDRVLEGFDGPFERITGQQKPAAAQVAQAQNAVGYLVSHHVNDAFIAVNRLLKAGEDVDTTAPLAYGFEKEVDVFFDNSPVFRLAPDAALHGVRAVAWFGDGAPLRSGWAWGQGYLDGGIAVVDASLGKGKVLLFGPEITFRAQPHGTFKFLFNGIYYGKAPPARAGETSPTAQ